MPFDALKTPIFPLEKAFEEASIAFSLPNVLPDDVGALQTLLMAQQKVMQTLRDEAQTMHTEMQIVRDEAQAARVEAQAVRDEAHAYIIRMLEQATLARQRMFGASSEQTSAQSRLFDEAEVLASRSALPPQGANPPWGGPAAGSLRQRSSNGPAWWSATWVST